MFLFVPWATDAPIYHWPIATGITIGVNIIVYVLQVAFPDLTEALMITLGNFNPLTWITAVYAHLDLAHLIGNMIFLFTFGIIVEGKIGWWRFFILYNLIGVLASAAIAILFLFSDGGCLGASCAIFGTMTVAMIWAPENEIHYKAILVIFFRPYVFDFDVSVLVVSFFYIAMNLLFAAIRGFSMSTETAHLLGVVPGAVLGVSMILLRWVDCEGFDLVARLRGTRGVRVKTVKQEADDEKAAEEEKARVEQEYRQGMNMCVKYLNAGHYDMARKRFEIVRKLKPRIKMPEKWILKMIKGATVDGRDSPESVKLMQEYLREYSEHRVPMTLRIARWYVADDQQRPRKAIKVLGGIREEQMTKQQASVFNAIIKLAKKQIADGVIELDELT